MGNWSGKNVDGRSAVTKIPQTADRGIGSVRTGLVLELNRQVAATRNWGDCGNSCNRPSNKNLFQGRSEYAVVGIHYADLHLVAAPLEVVCILAQ